MTETDSMEVLTAILGHSSTRPTRRYAKVQQKVTAQGLKKRDSTRGWLVPLLLIS
ncbi:hypothetical protein ACOL23_03370 [Aliarcobacter butzleri]